MRDKPSWTAKLERGRPHQVKPAPIDIAGMKAGEIMLVPSPRIVADFIAAIPWGTAMDVPTLRRRLAAAHGAAVTCPITMGFHLRTVAEAALEARALGADAVTPFWRVLDEGSPIAARLSCGLAFISQERAREGIVQPSAEARRPRKSRTAASSDRPIART